jgi:hypothetical protein
MSGCLLYLADTLQKTDGYDCSIIASYRRYWRQKRQQSRPEYAKQQQKFAADLLCQCSTENLRRYVAIEEGSQNNPLLLRIPVERARLCAHKKNGTQF